MRQRKNSLRRTRPGRPGRRHAISPASRVRSISQQRKVRRNKVMRAFIWRLSLALSVALAAATCGASAQSKGTQRGPSKAPVLETTRSHSVNDTTVNIISGSPNGTYLLFVYDMSAVLDDADLRIMPIVGKGGGQNVLDILKLKGVDLGITQT